MMMKKIQNREGYALVITLVLLVVLSIILIATFQNSSLSLLVAKSFVDFSSAQSSTVACEQHQVRRILNNGYSPFSLTNPVNCTSSVVERVGANLVPGMSAEILSVDFRFSTQGKGKGQSTAESFTYVTRLIDLSSDY